MENPPTFHTVRSLANSLAKKVEESKEAIQKNTAHKSVDTQLIYQEGMICPSMMHRFSLLRRKVRIGHCYQCYVTDIYGE